MNKPIIIVRDEMINLFILFHVQANLRLEYVVNYIVAECSTRKTKLELLTDIVCQHKFKMKLIVLMLMVS